ncbi:VOC family protein [Frankia sp. AiPa1]|uniref:VOC family protein n=1 Tax=Frankia sp. AiPa1 TaxID=573492 RepID=UPI002552018C
MARVQVALNVSDVGTAVEFYTKLFGVEPAKRRRGTRTSPSMCRRWVCAPTMTIEPAPAGTAR